MTTPNQQIEATADVVAGLIDDYLAIMPALDPEDARIAVGLWRQLAEGAPVARADLADRLGLPQARIDDALDGPLAGTCVVDDEDRIRAFWALSLADQPSPHRLLLDDRTLYAWCVPDVLFLPLLIGRTLVVQSTMTTTDEPTTLVIHPDRLGDVHAPDETVVSFVPAAPDGLGDSAASMMSTYCHHQLFFPDAEAGRRWAHERGRDDLVLVPLQDAFDGCQRLFRTLLGDAVS